MHGTVELDHDKNNYLYTYTASESQTCGCGYLLIAEPVGGVLQEFSGCSCTGPAAAPHQSVDCVNECPVYGAYWFILFLSVISHSMTHVGVVMLLLRFDIDNLI